MHIIKLVEMHDGNGNAGYFSNRLYIDNNNARLQRITGDIDVLLTSSPELDEENDNLGICLSYFL